MIQSPCNKICTLNAQNVCVGCGRSRAEIGAWSQLSDADKTQVVRKAKERLAALASVEDTERLRRRERSEAIQSRR